MKNSQWIGIAAALVLLAACFMPWAYFPDLGESFTGFFSEQNRYGRPGKVLIVLCSVMIIFFLVPRVWAKRANIFAGAVTFAWCVKSFILYSACYRGICPDRKAGLFIVLAASVVTLVAALFPDLPVKEDRPRG